MESLKFLVLDIGNTQSKYGLFYKNSLVQAGVCSDWMQDDWQNFTAKHDFSTVFIGSVGPTTKQILLFLPNNIKIYFVDQTTKYPFSSTYSDINSLGVDRRAAISGAITIYPQKPLLIIDAGSCITYDFVDVNGVHQGGAISPGRSMRYQAVHLGTAKLPLVNPVDEMPNIGTSTKTSIHLGVEFGVIAEIKGQIDRFSKEFGDFTTILTGGDSDFLIKKIKNGIFANSDLNLVGLYRLLTFNGLHEK
jgi:type III pantothenate kinase